MEELNNVNLNNYRIFYIVCQTMNFTKASEILNEKSDTRQIESTLQKNLKVKVIMDELDSIIHDENSLDEEVNQRLEFVKNELDALNNQKT